MIPPPSRDQVFVQGTNVPLHYHDLLIRLFERVNDPENRGSALQGLWGAANQVEYRHYFCHPNLPFFSIFQNIFINETNILNLELATGCLWFLSREHTIRPILSSQQNQFVPLLMNLLRTYGRDNPRMKEHILKALSNCSLESRVLPDLLHAEYGYLDYHKKDMIEFSNSSFSYQSIFNVISGLKDAQVELILKEYNVVEIIYNKIVSYGIKPLEWTERFRGVCYWCLNCLVTISALRSGARIIKEIDRYSDFFPYLAMNPLVEGVKAFFIMANVYGEDEEQNSKPRQAVSEGSQYKDVRIPASFHLITSNLILNNPELLRLTAYIFIAILDYRPNDSNTKELIRKGFAYSIIKLRDISAALFHIAIPQANKRILLNYPILIATALRAIQDFIDNRLPYHARGQLAPIVYGGGGGNDYESIENLLEFLLQLSYQFPEETEEKRANEKKNAEGEREEEEELSSPRYRRSLLEIEFCSFDNHHIPSILRRILELPSETRIATEKMVLLANSLLQPSILRRILDLPPETRIVTEKMVLLANSLLQRYKFHLNEFPRQWDEDFEPDYEKAWEYLLQLLENISSEEEKVKLTLLLNEFCESDPKKFETLDREQYNILASFLKPEIRPLFFEALDLTEEADFSIFKTP